MGTAREPVPARTYGRRRAYMYGVRPMRVSCAWSDESAEFDLLDFATSNGDDDNSDSLSSVDILSVPRDANPRVKEDESERFWVGGRRAEP